MIDRRDALKGLAAIAGATGLSMMPVTVRDAERVEMVILRPSKTLSQQEIVQLREAWMRVCEQTALERVRTIVLDGSLEVEFVRA